MYILSDKNYNKLLKAKKSYEDKLNISYDEEANNKYCMLELFLRLLEKEEEQK